MSQYAVAESTADVAEAAVIALDTAIRRVKKADWKGNRFKEKEVRNAIASILGSADGLVDTILEIAKAQHDYS